MRQASTAMLDRASRILFRHAVFGRKRAAMSMSMSRSLQSVASKLCVHAHWPMGPSVRKAPLGAHLFMFRFAKLNWKLLLAVPLLVSCLMIGIGGPVRPVLLGCLLGVAVRLLINAVQSS